MFEKKIEKLICPYCQKKIIVHQKISNRSGIVKCGCSFYPVIHNILYLKKDKPAKKAVYFLKKEKNIKALISILDLRKKQLYPTLLITFLNKFFTALGYQKTIKFLSFFSQTKDWYWYLINREKIPSFYISKISYNLTKRNNICIADLGCGTGQTLSDNTFAVDGSFVNLLLANIFFSKRNNILICCDLEKNLPFKTGILDLIISTDTFHYIHNKKHFLKETKRCLNLSGVLSVIHTLNIEKKRNILGLTPNRLKTLTKNIGFKKAYALSNEAIWGKISQNINSKINIKSGDTHIKKCYAFNLFASKKQFKNTTIKLPKINNKLITYSTDRELLNFINIRKLLNNYNNFIFISPHFDDTVLSCGLLLDCLQKNKKNILIVTFFTKASKKPYSKEAKVFVNKSGYDDANKLFKDRAIENKNALAFFYAKYLNLDFIDTVFRQNNIIENQKLKRKLKQSINNIKILPKTLILAPLGLGDHPDHILINKLIKKIDKPIIFWEDFPYNKNPISIKSFFRWNLNYQKAFDLIDSKNIRKNKAIKMYKSQMNPLFKKRKIPNLPEKYYYLKNSKISTNLFAELNEE